MMLWWGMMSYDEGCMMLGKQATRVMSVIRSVLNVVMAIWLASNTKSPESELTVQTSTKGILNNGDDNQPT